MVSEILCSVTTLPVSSLCAHVFRTSTKFASGGSDGNQKVESCGVCAVV